LSQAIFNLNENNVSNNWVVFFQEKNDIMLNTEAYSIILGQNKLACGFLNCF
jgi:hypothetical protein